MNLLIYYYMKIYNKSVHFQTLDVRVCIHLLEKFVWSIFDIIIIMTTCSRLYYKILVLTNSINYEGMIRTVD